MPSRKIHNKVAKLIFPEYDMEKIDKVNKEIDAPSKIFGPRHRKYFGHDLNLLTLLYLSEDPDRIPLWFIHNELDKVASKDKELKKLMELIELL